MARRTANRRAKMAPRCPPAANASRFDRRLARTVEVDDDDEGVEVDATEGEDGEAMLLVMELNSIAACLCAAGRENSNGMVGMIWVMGGTQFNNSKNHAQDVLGLQMSTGARYGE